MSTRILLVEDDLRYANRMKKNLSLEGYEIILSSSGEKALDLFRQETFDLVITDIKMPGMNGIDLLKRLIEMQRKEEHDVPIMLLTSVDSVRVAVDAMKEGAADYITKDSEKDEVLLRIQKVITSARVREENRSLRKKVEEGGGFGRLISESEAMQSLLREIDEIADTGAGILISGETGVGKELVARYIHNQSPRAHAPFIDINCAALPSDNLFQSEVFGHEKGAFTGATSRKRGRMELADGGTLFLDEIGDMPMESQGKILRALETLQFERLGGTQKIKVDLAVIAASNKDLNEEVELGHFRQDLLYRLDIIRLNIPPLREHPDDILPIAQHFLEEYARKYRRTIPPISEEAVHLLRSYSWPGNVRELKNLIERIIIRNRDCTLLDKEILRREGIEVEEKTSVSTSPLSDDNLSLEEIEKRAIIQALEKSDWIQSEAAKRLKISPDRMHNRIKKYGISHPSWRTYKNHE